MPRPHTTMRKVRDVLRLSWGEQLSLRQVARSLAMPHTTVAVFLRRAKEAGLAWPLPEDLDDDALERRLFGTASAPSSSHAAPDFAAVKKELAIKGVTLQLLWLEYRELHPDGYGYSQFCHLYRTWRRHLSVVMRFDHKAGEKLFVDYPGMTIPIYDERDLTVSFHAELFVAVLGASSYTFATATRSQQIQDWISRRTWRPSSSWVAAARSWCPTIFVLVSPRRIATSPTSTPPTRRWPVTPASSGMLKPLTARTWGCTVVISAFRSVGSHIDSFVTRQLRVAERARVPQGGVDAESEEVADAANVTTGGVDLLENAILSEGLGSEVCVRPGELASDGNEAWRTATTHEQVRVDAARPASRPMVKPRGEAHAHGVSEGNDATSEVEPAVDDVGELQLAELLAGQRVKGDQRYRQGDGGIGRVEGLTDRFGVQRQRHAVAHGREGHAAGGVEKDQLAPLQHLEQRPESALGEVTVSATLGEESDAHVVGRDLGQRLVTGGGPRPHDRCDAHDLEARGLGVAGALARSHAAPAEHDFEPDFQLRSHRLGQIRRLGGEVSLDVRRAVIDEEPGGVEDVQRRVDVALVAGQLQYVRRVDLRPRSLLEHLEESEGIDHDVALPLAPSVCRGVISNHLAAVSDQLAVARQGPLADHLEIGIEFEQRELAPGDGRERRALPTPRLGFQTRGPASLELQVREEELLSGTVRVGEVERTTGFLGETRLLQAESTRAPFAHRRGAPAVVAVGVRVVALPPATDPASASFARHAPGQAAAARSQMRRTTGMARLAQSLAEVLRRGARSTRRRDERTTGQAVVAVVDAGCDPRDSLVLTPVTARRRSRQRGGSDRGLLKRGVTVADPEPASAICCRGGRCDATLSGSGMSRDDGSHASTEQIMSKSSRRIVVGVPVQSADILPALTSKPASASRRRSSVDFQIPHSAALSRRFHCIVSHLSLEASFQTSVRVHPGPFDVIARDVDVARRRRQPLVAQQLLERFQIHPTAIQRGRAVVTQHVRRQPTRPRRQPQGRLGREAPTQRIVGDASAVLGVERVSFTGQQGSIGIGPVLAELVTHVGQPPIDQLVRAVDRGHQTRFRASTSAPLTVTHQQLAELAQIRTPIADVQHHRLVDAQAQPTPERRREIVPRGWQVLAGFGYRRTPSEEEFVDLRVRRRHPDLAERGARLSVELVDRLFNDDPGQRVDISLISADYEFVELRQHARLAGASTDAASRSALVGEEPVGVVTRRRPQVLGHGSTELNDYGAGVIHVCVSESCGRHRQSVLIDQLLLEILSVFSVPKSSRRSYVANRRQPHQLLSSSVDHIPRLYRLNFRNPEKPSIFPISERNLGMHRYGGSHGAKWQNEQAGIEAHYGMAIIPARPYKPRDKAKAEVGVQIAERWIIAVLRHQRFTSLAALNEAIGELVERLNLHPPSGWRVKGLTIREKGVPIR